MPSRNWLITGVTDANAVRAAEPGGTRTEFRYGGAQVAEHMPEYDGNPAKRKLSR